MNFGNKMRTVIGAAVLATLVACAGDKNQAQYQSQLTEQNLAAGRAISGDYIGTGTDNQQHDLGAMKIHIDAKAFVAGSSCPTTNSIITGAVSLDGVVTAHNIAISNGCYDPNNNSLSGQLNIPASETPYSLLTVYIQGVIGGGHFSGTIDMNSADAQPLNFDVQMGGQVTVSDYSTSQRAQQLGTMGTKTPVTYRANAIPLNDGTGRTTVPTLVIQDPGSTGEAQLFNLLSPSRLVSIYMNSTGPVVIGGVPVVSSQAFINNASSGGVVHIEDVYGSGGIYTGQTISAVQTDNNCTSGSGSCQVSLSCTSFDASGAKAAGFTCTEVQPHGSTIKNVQFYLVQDPAAKQ